MPQWPPLTGRKVANDVIPTRVGTRERARDLYSRLAGLPRYLAPGPPRIIARLVGGFGRGIGGTSSDDRPEPGGSCGWRTHSEGHVGPARTPRIHRRRGSRARAVGQHAGLQGAFRGPARLSSPRPRRPVPGLVCRGRADPGCRGPHLPATRRPVERPPNVTPDQAVLPLRLRGLPRGTPCPSTFR